MASDEVETEENKKNPRCFLDISIDGKPEGKIIVELFAHACPKTAENFRSLCVGDKGIGKTTGKPLHFKGCPFHKIIKKYMIEGGDFSNQDGTGGESIYGEKFEDENFNFSHNETGLLSMVNTGPNTNGSQFFIICEPSPQLDEKHVVFGKVISGLNLVRTLENIETENNKPKKSCIIEDCGEIPEEEEVSFVNDDGTGDTYADYPQDSKLIDFTKFSEVADAAEKIKKIGNEQFKLKKYEIALKKYQKALRYLDYEELESLSSSGSEDDTSDENNPDRFKSVALPCHLNSAACHLKLKNYKEASESCDEAKCLDEKNVKALYREGQAYAGLKKYDKALECLQTAAESAPGDKGIQSEIVRVKNLDKEEEKKKYAKLFT